MVCIADEQGKIRVEVAMDGATASFCIVARDGRAFAPGEQVEYTDDAWQSLLQQVLQPFQVEAAPVEASER